MTLPPASHSTFATGHHWRTLVPVTAKLSRRFYETFGDELANEFVDWFNSVDATYRADLRELNEINAARLDAKLAELKSELLKWMFLFWATTGVALGGLFFRK
jgi:hypothetical protein